VLLRNSLDEAIAAAAADVMLQARACVRAFESFHLAIEPSPASQEVVVRLLTDPNYRDLPWSRTHLWSAREPRTPTGEDEMTSHLAEMLLHGSDLPRDQWHPPRPHLPDADARYEAELIDVLSQREPGHDRLDCLLIPGTPESVGGVVDPMDRLVGPTDNGEAITLSRRARRGGRLVMIVAPGPDSRDDLSRFAADHGRVGVRPLGGQLRWYIDRLACGHQNLE